MVRTDKEMLIVMSILNKHKIPGYEEEFNRGATLALEYAIERNCEHQLTGKNMNVKTCESCQRYWGMPVGGWKK